ncbi:MAG: DUF937 domain-containing protein [Novosphingobium sp.]
MIEMLDTLRRTGGLAALSRHLNLTPTQASAGTDALLPFLLGGFKRYCQRHDSEGQGLPALLKLLNLWGDGEMAAAVLIPGNGSMAAGPALLEAIFGSPEAIVSVASAAAQRSELDTAQLRKMLPLLAMLLGGYISIRAAPLHGNDNGVPALLELEHAHNPLDEVLPPEED